MLTNKGKPSFFNCPNCKALFQTVKVKAGPETDNQRVTCQNCGHTLVGRQGNLVVKYFYLRPAGRKQTWRRLP